MKYLLLLAVLVVGCDHTRERAIDHLRSLGYKEVACSGEEDGGAICSADGSRFHCVTAEPQGCGASATACERFIVEKASP